MALTERLLILIDAKSGGAVGEFGKVQKKAQVLEAQSTRTSRALDKLGVSGTMSGQALKSGMVAGAAVAGTALAGFAAKAVGAFTTTAAEIRDFQRASGASAIEASKFVEVLGDLKVSTEVGTKAIFKMSREIGQGGGELQRYGVAVARTAAGTTDLTGTLLNVADAYVATQDSARRAALVQAAFGRAGAELIPVLEQGREGLARFFEGVSEEQLFSEKDLREAREFELAIDGLEDAMGDLGRTAARHLIPALTGLAAKAERAVYWIERLGSAPKGFIEKIEEGLLEVATLGEYDKELEDIYESWRGGATSAGSSTRALKSDVKGLGVALDELTDPISEATTGLLALFDAEGRVRDNARELAQALKDAHEDGRISAEEQDRFAEMALRSAEAIAELDRRQAEANHTTQDATRKNAVIRAELIRVAQSLAPSSPLRVHLDDYIARLLDVPTDIETRFRLLGVSEAVENFRQLERNFANAPALPVVPASTPSQPAPAGRTNVVIHNYVGGQEVTGVMTREQGRRADLIRRAG